MRPRQLHQARKASAPTQQGLVSGAGRADGPGPQALRGRVWRGACAWACGSCPAHVWELLCLGACGAQAAAVAARAGVCDCARSCAHFRSHFHSRLRGSHFVHGPGCGPGTDYSLRPTVTRRASLGQDRPLQPGPLPDPQRLQSRPASAQGDRRLPHPRVRRRPHAKSHVPYNKRRQLQLRAKQSTLPLPLELNLVFAPFFSACLFASAAVTWSYPLNAVAACWAPDQFFSLPHHRSCEAPQPDQLRAGETSAMGSSASAPGGTGIVHTLRTALHGTAALVENWWKVG